MPDAALPPSTHNNPPEAVAFDAVKARVDELVCAANAWATKVPEIADEETAKKASDFLDQLQAELKAVEAQRRAEKKPHEDAAKAVDARFIPLKTLLETAKSILSPRLGAWLRKIRERQEAEARRKQEEALAAARAAEEAQRAAERSANPVQAQVAAQAAAKQAEKVIKAADKATAARPQVRGDFGRTKSLRTIWKARIEDREAFLQHVKDDPRITEALEAIAGEIARTSRGQREVPGLKIYDEQIAA